MNLELLLNREFLEDVAADMVHNLKDAKHSRVCSSCGTTITPQWRKGSFIGKSNKQRTLCNSCGIMYQKYGECEKCKKSLKKEEHKC